MTSQERMIIALAELYADRDVILLALRVTTNLAREALLRDELFTALTFSMAARVGLEQLNGIKEQIALIEQALGFYD